MWIKSFSIYFAAYRMLAFYGFRSSFCQGYMNGFAALDKIPLQPFHLTKQKPPLCRKCGVLYFLSFICRLLHRAVARSARFRQEGRQGRLSAGYFCTPENISQPRITPSRFTASLHSLIMRNEL